MPFHGSRSNATPIIFSFLNLTLAGIVDSKTKSKSQLMLCSDSV
jgi:hypothetical protein